MSVKIETGTQFDVDGREINRLIVFDGSEPVDSVIIGLPMTIDCAIEKLELLAWRLKLYNTRKAHSESK